MLLLKIENIRRNTKSVSNQFTLQIFITVKRDIFTFEEKLASRLKTLYKEEISVTK